MTEQKGAYAHCHLPGLRELFSNQKESAPATDREKTIAELRETVKSVQLYGWSKWPKTDVTYEHVRFLLSQLQSAQQDREKLIEGLRWYADKSNYMQEFKSRHGTLVGPAEAIYYDNGQRARDILKEIGVGGD